MKQMSTRILVVIGLLGLLPAGTNAQPFGAAGTRAAGMGGAFVGVSDDASAFYWNPAGMAAGAFFSLVIDSGTAEALSDQQPTAADRSSFLLALSTPALGIGYYRLHQKSASVPFGLLPIEDANLSRNVSVVGEMRVDSLVTHHAGLTLVQSITQGVAVGTTLKLVRGIAASQLVPATSPAAALEDEASELLGRASNTFDLDVGLMAYGGPMKVGLTLRNVREPGFRVAGSDDEELILERQARVGLSYAVTRAWLAAADFDLTKTRDAAGLRRDAALGVEGRLGTRIWTRAGLRLNTADDDRIDIERGRAYSVGASYAARAGAFVDAHFTRGTERFGDEWGISARFVY